MTDFQAYNTDTKNNGDIDQRCMNCGYRFYDHYNGKCPDVAMEEATAELSRYRWYSNINWGPCYDPATKAHYASATDIETLQEKYGPIDMQSLQIHDGHQYHWITEGESRSQWDQLQDLLADLRDKATNNATTGSQDERDAWTGMASELSRAMNLNIRNRV